MNWKELIRTLEKPSDLYYLPNPSATVEQIAELEEILKVSLPGERSEFYLQTDGMTEEMEVAGVIGYLVLPIERVIEDNLSSRKWESDIESLLFVSPNGFGDYYGYQIQDGRIASTEMYAWNHENGKRTRVASSLKDLLEGRTKGTLTNL